MYSTRLRQGFGAASMVRPCETEGTARTSASKGGDVSVRCRTYGARNLRILGFPALPGWAKFCRASRRLPERVRIWREPNCEWMVASREAFASGTVPMVRDCAPTKIKTKTLACPTVSPPARPQDKKAVATKSNTDCGRQSPSSKDEDGAAGCAIKKRAIEPVGWNPRACRSRDGAKEGATRASLMSELKLRPPKGGHCEIKWRLRRKKPRPRKTRMGHPEMLREPARRRRYDARANYGSCWILPPLAETISWTSSSVIFGSRPSVWPLPARITSATTRPSLQSGYWMTSAAPGRGKCPQESEPGFWRVGS